MSIWAEIWLANIGIFSHSGAGLLTLLIVSFDAQNFLISVKSSLSNISFFGDISRKSLPSPTSWRFTPMFSFKKFILLALTFKSFVHFELIFINCLWKGPNSFFACGYSTVLVPFVEKTILSLLNGSRKSLAENQLTLKFTQHIHMSIFMPASHCLYYCFVAGFEIGKCKSSNFVLLFQDFFGYSGSPAISYEF